MAHTQRVVLESSSLMRQVMDIDFRAPFLLGVVLMCHATALVAQTAPTPSPKSREQMQQIRDAVSSTELRRVDEKLVAFWNRNTLSSMDPQIYQQGRGVKAAREWIQAEFERVSAQCGGCLNVQTLTFTQQPAPRVPQATEIADVYAVLQGTDPVESKHIYLVTGHYDTRNGDTLNTKDEAPGANDDTSGTAVSLECARVLSRYKFPGTIVFLAVAGEEQGLNGSDYFARWAKQQGWQIEAVLNNDIVGGNTTPGDTLQRKDTVRVFSEGLPITALEDAKQSAQIRSIGAENDSSSRELAREVAEIGKEWMPPAFQPKLIFRQDRYLRGGDHTSFNKQNYAAVRLTEWREDYNHQHQDVRVENGTEFGDLIKFVDFDYVANVARLNALSLAAMALAPAPPSDVRLLTKQLENSSTLVWSSSEDQRTEFEVVWRDTTAADWQNSKYVGKVTRATMPESKDNVIFGVRAVSPEGFKSYAVTPVPER